MPMGFSRQECWSVLPCPSPGDLRDPGIKPGSRATLALQVDSLALIYREAHLTLQETLKLSFKVAVPFTFPPAMDEFLLLCILIST